MRASDCGRERERRERREQRTDSLIDETTEEGEGETGEDDDDLGKGREEDDELGREAHAHLVYLAPSGELSLSDFSTSSSARLLPLPYFHSFATQRTACAGVATSETGRRTDLSDR